MSSIQPKIKENLHPRNVNRVPYDIPALLKVEPELNRYLTKTPDGEQSINFSHPTAVKKLNQALLKHYYKINYWDFPAENLCPPIPGRADYIHYVADLLAETQRGQIPKGEDIRVLDIGTGASMIYPILCQSIYQWKSIGTDISKKSLETAKSILDHNPSLQGKIQLRLQKNPNSIFKDILNPKEKVDATLCNPPFHPSVSAARRATHEKNVRLNGKNVYSSPSNFSGNFKELVCEGGELAFIQRMIDESVLHKDQCQWFTTLVSKSAYLKRIEQSLKQVQVADYRIIQMGTGNKITRMVAWTFIPKK